MNVTLSIVDVLTREAMLFAAAGFLIGGLDDLLVDLFYLHHRIVRGAGRRLHPTQLTQPVRPGRIAVFVPAWDEADVIGAMLASALAGIDHADYAIYVGVYPNDAATIAAVSRIAADDRRVRIVVGAQPGPTTKADNLNRLWHALLAEERAAAVRVKAVVLHDAEDLIHPLELRAIDSLIEGRAVVQLPVLPLVDRGARMVSGHYADEFAESHAKTLVVRQALGAGLPLAGTGCGIARDTLATLADQRGGAPFDANSLTEDYELGLRIADIRGRSLFARIGDGADGLIAVRAYFPGTIPAATRQKARWMTGIALAGWDRTGWASGGGWRDHWMRMRDRRAPLAVVVLAVAYLAVLAWGARAVLHAASGTAPPDDGPVRWLLVMTMALLSWRIAVRAAFTWRCYGWREACWSVPPAVRRQRHRAGRGAARARHLSAAAARRATGLGQDRASIPRSRRRADVSDGRPLRFLLLALGGWTTFRVVALWPAPAAEPPRTPARTAKAAIGVRPAATANPDRTIPAYASAASPLPSPSARRVFAFSVDTVAPLVDVVKPPPVAAASRQRSPRSVPPPFVLPSLPSVAATVPSRWAASIYGIVRGGARTPLLGGQLGGSQAGARVTYLLDPGHRIAAAARVASAIGTRGQELGIGLDWQPLRLPLHVIAEQRIGIRGYRGGPSLSVVGGIGPVAVAPRVRIEGYAQAGGIARGGIEGFADGSVRAAYRLASADGSRRDARLDLGLGAWGGAQRGATRLDIGPSLGLVAPVAGTAVRLTLDWRQRVAGDAAPGSGPALTIGGNF